MSIRRRRLINDPARMVADMLDGYVAAHPHIIRLNEHRHVVRANPKDRGKVGLVIGNGSGHEPAMIGWVGPGLFDVNVPGDVFAAPGPSALLAGILAADAGAGVLLCVSHHAGDLMNAEIALERARSAGASVEMVVLYDDVGSAPKGREPERRGGAGLFFVWKIVGAFAETGAGLAECKEMAERVRDNTRTITAAFGTVAHPVSGQPLSDLDQNELVLGVGVHGDSGIRVGGDASADVVVDRMLSTLLEDGDFRAGEKVCVLVNNSGALTVMELSIIYRAVDLLLAARDIAVHRVWIGSYATTQDLAGFALAISRIDEETSRLYDRPALGAGLVMAASEPRGVPR